MLDKEGRSCRSHCHVRERAEPLAQGKNGVFLHKRALSSFITWMMF